MNVARVMGLALVLVLGLGMVHGNLNDPELYVADYYPQSQVDTPPHPPPLRYRYHYLDEDDYMRSDEPGYFADYSAPTQYNNRALEKNVLEFLGKNELQNDDPSDILNKRVLSSFRERMEREKSKEQQEKIAEMFLDKLREEAEDRELEREYDNRDYIEMIQNLWEKYKNSQYEYDKNAPVFVGEVKKRQIQIPADYSTLGWSGVGYRKRVDMDVDVPELYSGYPPEFLYAKRKRFPVAKRSSNFYGFGKSKRSSLTNNNNGNKKVLVAASGTDPKVVEDLSHLFGNKQNITESKQVTSSSSSTPVKDTIAATADPGKDHLHSHSPSHLNHEAGFVNDEPLNIQKKSIDWSNYFGIDRRKKKSQSFTNENEIDNDWLIKRYNKAVAMAVKRSSEYPLNIFRNHNTKKDEIPETEENRKLDSKYDETKLRDMDDKLKNIEDIIIDEALKYTGAHEGETDPAEIQEVKDKVISRLAAAYSLEKMRRALSEFKSSLTAQKNEHGNGNVNVKGNTPSSSSDLEPEPESEREDSMKKKSTEAERKCTSKSGCEDTNTTSNEIQVVTTGTGTGTAGRCNIIENRCRRLMSGGGGYSGLFYSLCKWHQLCYLCQDDVDAGTCDLLLLSRADALCRNDVVCQWAARPALAYLRQLQDTAPQQPHCDRAAVCTR